MSGTWVTVFAKYPTAGAVNTRLVPPLTEAEAAAIQRACLEYVLARVSGVSDCRRVLAMTPDDRVDVTARAFRDVLGPVPEPGVIAAPTAADARWSVCPQGDGDLGRRLARVMGRVFGRGAANLVIVGTDSPVSAPARVEEAVRLLDEDDVVLGPCGDGGYYLIASRVPKPALFENIDWEGTSVAAQTLGNAARMGLTVSLLPVGYDIDRSEDLTRALADLKPAAPGSLEHRLRSALLGACREAGLAGDELDLPETVPTGSEVLVVEDHPQSRELLRIYMESIEGVAVVSAADGVSAIELAEARHPDLILLDIMMPKMSGFEVCRRLKEQPRTRDIPVVIVTALDAPGDVERAAECRADEYFTKPFDRARLLARARELLIRRARLGSVVRRCGKTGNREDTHDV